MVREIEVFAEPKRKPHQKDSARDERERRHQEDALDEALKDTFPASDRFHSSSRHRPPPTATRQRPEGRAVPFHDGMQRLRPLDRVSLEFSRAAGARAARLAEP